MTPDDVGDITEVSDLPNQIEVDVASMTADGGYDGEVIYDVVAERHPEAAVIVPPRITAVLDETIATQRDEHLAMITEHGRMSWQRSSGYNRSRRQTSFPRGGAAAAASKREVPCSSHSIYHNGGYCGLFPARR